MGFLSKIGNVLQDTASFAAPAGLTLGATALTGGNPLAGKALLAALGAGAKGLQANEQEERARKMMKRQNQNNATANLINTLSPTARYQPNQAKAPRAGLLETISGGVGMGVDAYRTADALRRHNEALDRSATKDQAAIDALRGADDAARDRFTAVTSEGTPQPGAIQMPETVVTAKAPEKEAPLGYLSGAAAERRMDRAQDLQEQGNMAAVQASQARLLQDINNQLQLASLVANDPSTFQNLGSAQKDAALGLAMMGPQGVEVLSNVSGRQLSSDQISKISEGMAARGSIAEADRIIQQLTEMGDTGVMGSFNLPGGEAAKLTKRLDQIFAILPSQMRNATEAGVMNDRDEARWATQIPDIRAYDTESQLAAWNDMKKGVESKYQQFGQMLIDQGFNVGSMEFGTTAPKAQQDRVEALLNRLMPQ